MAIELVDALGLTASQSRNALELESAALEPVSAFATAAQGELAENAGPSFASRAAASTKDLTAYDVVSIERYNPGGTVYPALYERVPQPGNVEPSHEGKFQDATGDWFEIVYASDPRMLGAVCDGETNDTASIRRWINVNLAKEVYVLNWPGRKMLVGGGDFIQLAYPGQSVTFGDDFIFLVDGVPQPLTNIFSGTELIVAGEERGEWGNLFGDANCAGVTYAGLCSVRYQHPAWTQGTCTGKTSTTLTILLDDGFKNPTFSDIQRIEQYDDSNEAYGPVWKRVLFSQFSGASPASFSMSVTDGILTLTGSGTAELDAIAEAEIGQRYLLTSQIYGADIFQSRFGEALNILGEITVNHTAGIGVRTERTGNIDLSGMRLAPILGSVQMITSPGGGSLLFDVKSYLVGYNFYMWGCGDDPINVGTRVHYVDAVIDANTFTTKDEAYPYQPPIVGDPLVWVNGDGTSQSIGEVVSVSSAGSGWQVEMDTNLPVGFGPDDLVYDPNLVPTVDLDGFLESYRGHGFLIQASKSRVRGRCFNGSSAAVQCWFFPSYFTEGALLEDIDIDISAEMVNTGDASPAAISVSAYLPDGSGVAPFTSAYDINIRGLVVDTAQSAVQVAGATDVDISVTVDNACYDPSGSYVNSFAAISIINVFKCAVSGVGRDKSYEIAVINSSEIRTGSVVRMFCKDIMTFANVDLRANLSSSEDFANGAVIKGFSAENQSAVGYDDATGVITVNEPGWYQVTGQVTIAGGSGAGGGSVSLFAELNGGESTRTTVFSSGTTTNSISISDFLFMGVGDTLTLKASGDGDGLNVAMYYDMTRLSVRKVQ